jgi:Dehydrogenases with different specificities (related to short-chain alcohol dehydrogenases)
MVIDLSGHLALVTGGGGELGRVIARTLAGCGAGVVVHYHRGEEKAQAVADDIRGAGGRAMIVAADVGDEASVFAMKAVIEREMGALPDILVNNAVTQYPWKSILEQPVEDFDSQYRSCVLQNVLMAKAFAPAMTAKGWGRIIAINTECSMQCYAGQGAYVSGKRGMDGVLRVLAREVGPSGVTVNQVAPGWMISDRDRTAGTERSEGYEKNVPLRRRGDDQDIANAVAFLASDLADFITGVYLPVCGGNVMPTI